MADTAHAKAVTLVAVCYGHAATVEVQMVRVVSIGLCGRPIVSVCTGVLQRTVRVVAVSDSGRLYSRRLHYALRDVVPNCLYVNEPLCVKSGS